MPARSFGLTVLGLLMVGGVGVLAALGAFDPPAPRRSPPATPPVAQHAGGVAPADAAAAGSAHAGVAGAPPDGNAAAPQAPADDATPAPTEDTTWLLSQVRTAQGFRARTAAVLALGRRRGPRVEAGLIAALSDEHPSVRTAAASALSRSSGADVKEALRAAQARENDAVAQRALGRAHDTPVPEPIAPSPAPIAKGGLYVSLPKPRAQGALDAGLLERADAVARAQARRLPGARMAPSGETAGAAEAVLRAEGRAGFQLDVTLGIEAVSAGARATANVLVATYPGRSIRGFAKGAATASGDPQDPELQLVALEHAIASAFSDLPRMLESSGP